MSAELTLACLATVDLAIKYGKELIRLYSAFKNAGSEINERIIRVEGSWIRTQMQISFLVKIWETLDIVHQEQQSQTLEVLATKLNSAITQVKRVQRRPQGKGDDQVSISRWKYAMIKETIDKALEELETWQRIFDPSWYLIIKMANPIIDSELVKDAGEKTSGSMVTARSVRDSLKAEPETKKSIFLPPNGLTGAQRDRIPYCTAELMLRRPRSNKYYILDPVFRLPDVNAVLLKKDVRNLARRLSVTEPMTFGLLQCHGVLDHRVSNQLEIVHDDGEQNEMGSNNSRTTGMTVPFEFVFHVPSELKRPRSLRHILLPPDVDISLSNRFRVAQQLAQSVSYVHTCDFVHKSIRPDTILVFANDKSTIAASFLLGFENFRTASGRTLRAGDSAWERDLYRHPRRQGIRPEDEYTMQHDIYSLGVCLLEIGLWESLVAYPGMEKRPYPSHLLLASVNSSSGTLLDAAVCKQHLVDLAQKRLPSRMGDRYTEVVVNCLTCLDEDNMDFGDQSEFEDDDGIVLGVRFIEKILLQLNNISV